MTSNPEKQGYQFPRSLTKINDHASPFNMILHEDQEKIEVTGFQR